MRGVVCLVVLPRSAALGSYSPGPWSHPCEWNPEEHIAYTVCERGAHRGEAGCAVAAASAVGVGVWLQVEVHVDVVAIAPCWAWLWFAELAEQPLLQPLSEIEESVNIDVLSMDPDAPVRAAGVAGRLLSGRRCWPVGVHVRCLWFRTGVRLSRACRSPA